MNRTSATRQEMLERNPHLKKYWLGRLLIGPILAGALLENNGWKTVRFALITTPLLTLIFAYNMLHGTIMSRVDNIIGATFIVCFTLGWPLIGYAAYGYKNKAHLDTTGAVKAEFDFRNLRRYYILWGMIGFGISSGLGIFAWLKW